MNPPPSRKTTRPRIGVVGGGFTGSVLTANLVRERLVDTNIVLIERSTAVGRGLAYRTQNPRHLLNVRASNMSAFPDDPLHFTRWLEGQSGAKVEGRDAFVSRSDYGLYIESVFHQTAVASQSECRVLHKSAVDIRPGATCVVSFSDGTAEEFDHVVLCIGNFAPAAPVGLGADIVGSPHFIKDPWDDERLAAIPADDPVLIVGSGLTMADVVDSLRLRGHQGPIDVISRHGLESQQHLFTSPYPPFLSADDLPMCLLALFRRIRNEVRRAATLGFDWRSVIDSLRPLTIHIWKNLSLDDRRRFLRHVRPYWDIHRHRLAPANADTIAMLRQQGRLQTHSGRIAMAAWTKNEFSVTFQRRRSATRDSISTRWIINCSGPLRDFARIDDSLVRNLFELGTVRPDPLRIGLDITPDYRLINREGQPWDNFYTLGPTTMGAFWEMIAVPDIRNACASFAKQLAEKVATGNVPPE